MQTAAEEIEQACRLQRPGHLRAAVSLADLGLAPHHAVESIGGSAVAKELLARRDLPFVRDRCDTEHLFRSAGAEEINALQKYHRFDSRQLRHVISSFSGRSDVDAPGD